MVLLTGEVGEETGVTVILAEETVCLKIVENAENWIATTKKIMQGNSFNSSEIAKGTPLDTIRELYRDGRSIPLNLDYEMRPLRAALRDARDWVVTNRDILVMLGIMKDGHSNPALSAKSDSAITPSGSSSSSSSSSGSSRSLCASTSPGGEGDDEKYNGQGVVDVKVEAEAEDNVATYERIFSCVGAAAHLCADFEELR